MWTSTTRRWRRRPGLLGTKNKNDTVDTALRETAERLRRAQALAGLAELGWQSWAGRAGLAELGWQSWAGRAGLAELGWADPSTSWSTTSGKRVRYLMNTSALVPLLRSDEARAGWEDELSRLALVHYDRDFDQVGLVTGQVTRWVAEPGSLP